MNSDVKLCVVIIGRNEGERLHVCLNSLIAGDCTRHLVYVDSGSTDDSVRFAEKLGCSVVNLDMRRPFTAARARNEGLVRALQLDPTLSFVQFVDGDCEVVNGWLDLSLSFLQSHPNIAIVCGRRRERYPEASIYNQLCDIEWDTPIGQARSCGGDALMRVDAFQSVGGYRADLIAGEEPELCVRLRASGWKIWRLDTEMTLHDAAITRFSQWWNRNKRAGYAFAEGAYLHGKKPERHGVRQTLRALIWGACIPLLTLIGGIYQPICFMFALLYPAQLVRIACSGAHKGRLAWLRAYFLLLGKFAETHGFLRFIANKLQHKAGTLIEYK